MLITKRTASLFLAVLLLFLGLTVSSDTISITTARAESQNYTTSSMNASSLTRSTAGANVSKTTQPSSAPVTSTATPSHVIIGSVSIPLNAQNHSYRGENAYQPNPVSIPVGATVTWVNNDIVMHTVTSGNSSDPNRGKQFDSGISGPSVLKNKGSTFNHTFAVAGTYQYFCEVHPSMVGKVVVGGVTTTVPEFPNGDATLGISVVISIIVILSVRQKLFSLNSLE